MDVWADDPWADNANLPKREAGRTDAVVAKAATVLNGFEDEAGWGDFESSGDNAWAEDPWADPNGHVDARAESQVTQEEATAAIRPRLQEEDPTDDEDLEDLKGVQDLEDTHEQARVSTDDSTKALSSPSEPTTSAATSPASGHDNVRSDDVQTLQEKQAVEQVGHSRHLSSSSDATLSTETASVASDRTSIEQGVPDEQSAHVHNGTQHIKGVKEGAGDVEAGRAENAEQVAAHSDISSVLTASAVDEPLEAGETTGPDFKVDLELFSRLYKGPGPKHLNLDGASEELIDSTSARKTWYRLSRPQTLRAFLSGDMDDTHVRVTWPSSHIRAETIKIVSRWTSEDRINGRTMLGGGARASFGWDEARVGGSGYHATSKRVSAVQMSSTEPRFTHIKRQSISMEAAASAASPVASFGWSTSPVDPTFSVVATQNPPVPAEHQVQNTWRISSRPASLHVAPSKLDDLAPSDSRQIENAPSRVSTLAIDTVLASHDKNIATEDDEWGDMVQSPLPETPTLQRATQSVTAHENAAPASGANSLLPSLQQRTPPASPIFLKQIVLEGPLSPARKAAFSAARVTRTLSSQQDTSPTQSLPPVSLPPVSLPHQKMVMHSIGLAGDDPLPERYKQIHVGNDDFNLFEDTLSTQAGASDAPRTTPKTALSRPEEKRVQDLLSQLPNLSYMFR